MLKEISPEYSLEGFKAEAEGPVVRPPDAKSHLIGKDPGLRAGGERGDRG